MDAVTRCKMRVTSVNRAMEADGTVASETVKLSAVHSNDPTSENAQWSKWTPMADFTIQINNPGAMGALANGHEFFVDFIPVPVEVPA